MRARTAAVIFDSLDAGAGVVGDGRPVDRELVEAAGKGHAAGRELLLQLGHGQALPQVAHVGDEGQGEVAGPGLG